MVRGTIVSHQVDAIIIATQFEIAVRRVQPAIDDLGHDYQATSDVQITWLSISTVAGVTLDSEGVLSIVIPGRDVVHRFIPRAAPSLDLRKSV